MFADDVKIYLKIINDLQLALTFLVEWANEWQLATSIEKCCGLNIGKLPAGTWTIVHYLFSTRTRSRCTQQQFMSECTCK